MAELYPSESSTSEAIECPKSGDSTAASLLDKLKSPDSSLLARQRKVLTNPPPVGKKRSTGIASRNDPGVHPSKRVTEYPGEHLKVSRGKLFCEACREILSVKRSTLANHITSSKHLAGKKRLKGTESKQKDIAEALSKYNADNHLRGESNPEEHNVFRVKVVKAFLEAGICLSKLKFFRPILEEGNYQLADRRVMQDLIPFILDQERGKIKDEIDGKHVAVIFDGTTRLGEVLAVVLRVVNGWTIQQRLVRLKFIKHSMKGEEVARELIQLLSTELGIHSHLLLAVMRDGASVNNVAMNTVSIVYPRVTDIGCFSHKLDHVGEKFNTPTLGVFSALWISLFAHSPKVKALWKEQTGRSMATSSKTRWWSRWEVLHQVLQQFGDVEPFLHNNPDISPATRSKLLQILSDPLENSRLKVELAVVIDLGKHFVEATYTLEGDGPLVVDCYETIVKLRAVIHSNNYPNTLAVIREFGQPPAIEQQWHTYALQCVAPGIQYFHAKYGKDSEKPLAVFKAARLFSPIRIHEIQPTASDLDQLKVFPFLDDPILPNLKTELPSYLAKASQVHGEFNILEWWKLHENELPNWASTAKKVILIQPSSAAAERVFSLLNNSFNDKQHSCLEDYIESSIMLQYNSR